MDVKEESKDSHAPKTGVKKKKKKVKSSAHKD